MKGEIPTCENDKRLAMLLSNFVMRACRGSPTDVICCPRGLRVVSASLRLLRPPIKRLKCFGRTQTTLYQQHRLPRRSFTGTSTIGKRRPSGMRQDIGRPFLKMLEWTVLCRPPHPRLRGNTCRRRVRLRHAQKADESFCCGGAKLGSRPVPNLQHITVARWTFEPFATDPTGQRACQGQGEGKHDEGKGEL